MGEFSGWGRMSRKTRIFTEMKHEIIYTEHYALIVSDEEMNENEYYLYKIDKWYINNDHYLFPAEAKKIIAHRPLTDAPILEGVHLLPEFSQEDDIKLIAKQEAEKLHDKSRHEDWDIYEELVSEDAWLIEKGFNKAKETYKYTEEDLRKAMYFGTHGEYGKEKTTIGFIQSLQQPKHPKYFECETEKVWVRNTDRNSPTLDDFDTIVKTTTNSQGQTELLGRYIF